MINGSFMAKPKRSTSAIKHIRAFLDATERIGIERVTMLAMDPEKIYDTTLNVTCTHYRISRGQLLGRSPSKRKDSIFVLIYVLYRDYNFRMVDIAQLIKRDVSVVKKYVKKFTNLDVNHPTDKAMWDNYEAVSKKSKTLLKGHGQ